MKTTKPQLVPLPPEPMTTTAFARHARTVVAHYGERVLAEVPTTLRRIGLFFLALSISIPAFFAGLLLVLWHVGH